MIATVALPGRGRWVARWSRQPGDALDVEVVGRLVEQQQLGVVDEEPGQGEAAALTTRLRVRRGCRGRPCPRRPMPPSSPSSTSRMRGSPAQTCSARSPSTASRTVQPGSSASILREHADVDAVGAALLGDAARVGLLEAGHDAQQRRLAAAVDARRRRCGHRSARRGSRRRARGPCRRRARRVRGRRGWPWRPDSMPPPIESSHPAGRGRARSLSATTLSRRAGCADDVGAVHRALGAAQVAAEVGGRERDREVERGLVALGEEGDRRARTRRRCRRGRRTRRRRRAAPRRSGRSEKAAALEVVVQGCPEGCGVAAAQGRHQLGAHLRLGHARSASPPWSRSRSHSA